MSPFYELQCVSCHKQWKEEDTSTRCLDCGNAIDILFDYEHIRSHLNEFALKNAPISGMKYLDFYPIRDRKKIVSLQEGNTSLYHAKKIGEKRGIPKLYIKDEGRNPTGVFKDRGSLVEVTKALELGAEAIVVASTGNMAASVSAYAGKAGIDCYVLIPEGTPIGKLSQSLAYGAKILQIRGTYADCVEVSEAMAKKYGYYLAGDYAFRGEGHKSIAFEIVEQLFWKVPDVVIMPMGCGTNIAAVWKGFQDFHALGIIDTLPRMIGVQPTGCSTIVDAFLKGNERFTLVEKPNTIASAVGIGVPIDDIKALRALRESGGSAVTIDDDTTLRVQQEMAELASIFTEPSGALPVASLESLKTKGLIGEHDTVVCVATGIGLKDPKAAVMMHSEAPSIEPNIESVDTYLSSGIAQIKTTNSQERKNDVVFATFPKEADLQAALQEMFHFTPSPELFQKFRNDLQGFFDKRSNMQASELKLFVDEFIANFGSGEKVLTLKDFSISTSLHQGASAEIRYLFQNEEFSAKAEGGGPVDAALTALKHGLAEKTDFMVHLKDYSVSIPSGGINVTVKVDILMQDTDQNKVIGTAASPDVIVASLQAFVNGFNLLWNKQK